ncbi:MAG: ribulose-phosphate 3-epimerase [Salinivirgaceae bacterium]|nr:ribulose-phosphate 3-epimerase [Salinivirgaceae bacterium]
MEAKVAPSLLSADFGNLARDIQEINTSAADYLHVDIMDGVFVPNISMGFPVLKAIKKNSQKPLDVHLMIVNPDQYIERFRDAGAAILTVHYEACTHLHRTIAHIKDCGMLAGVALNPHTPVEVLADIIQDVDLVLIMTVNPGYGGQKFIEHSYAKLLRLKKMMDDAGSKALVEVDGGVNFDNAEKLVNHGVSLLVAGNTVFSAPNKAEAVSKLKGR